MLRRLFFLAVMAAVFAGFSFADKKKVKQPLPDSVLNAQTVFVVIEPDARAPLNDPSANLKTQEAVEKALMKWGRFRLALDAETGDIVISIRRGSGKAASTTISGGPVDNHPISVETTDNQIRIGGKQGQPPSGTQAPDPGAQEGRAHPGTQFGGGEDTFKVYQGGVQYPLDASPIWSYSGIDALRPPNVEAVEKFRKAYEETEKAVAKKRQQQQPQPAIRAFVSAGGVPVAKAVVTGTMTGPDGKKSEIQLVDDGNFKAHGDDKANDGFYAARFAGTQVPGTYQISIVIRNAEGVTATPDEMDKGWTPRRISPFVRAVRNSFSVGRPEVKPPQTEK